jgi:hypothetical protein
MTSISRAGDISSNMTVKKIKTNVSPVFSKIKLTQSSKNTVLHHMKGGSVDLELKDTYGNVFIPDSKSFYFVLL